MKSTNLIFLFLFGVVVYWLYQNKKRIGDLQAAQAEDQKLFQFDVPPITIISATTTEPETDNTPTVITVIPTPTQQESVINYSEYFNSLISQ